MSRNQEIQKFLTEVEPKILKRGQDYFDSGRVEELDWDGDHVMAQVIGSEEAPYLVDIDFAPNGRVEDWSCDCPYDFGDVCKHTVVALLAIREEPERAAKKTPPFPALVEQAERGQLDSLILEYAKRDKGFRIWMISRLKITCLPPVEAAKERVKASIRANTRYGFIDEDGCDRICAELDEALDEARLKTKQGQHDEAMEYTLLVLQVGLKLALTADSSSGALEYTMDAAIKTVGLVADVLSKNTDSRRQWAKRLLTEAKSDAFDHQESCRYAFLRGFASLADKQTEGMFYQVLDDLEEEWRKGRIHCLDEDRIARYYIIQAVHGREKARDFIGEHLYIDELSIILFTDLMKEKAYPQAERLCQIKAEEYENVRWYRPSRWEYRLYEVYKAWGQRAKLIEQVQKLVLWGDRDLYQTLKKLLTEEGRWRAGYANLLGKLKTSWSSRAYMELLAQEDEKELLMEQLELHPGEVFRYSGGMLQQYNEQIRSLCIAEIQKAAGAAGNRKEYRQLCERLSFLADAGGVEEAQGLIRELRSKNLRRRALLEELERVEKTVTVHSD